MSRHRTNRPSGFLAASALMILLASGAAVAQQAPQAQPRPAATPQAPQQPQPQQRPPIEITPQNPNFGNVHPDELIHQTFTIRNTGSRALHIADYRVACNCTTARVNGNTISPGQSITVDVTVDLRGSIGDVKKDVNLIFTGYSAPVRLEMTGTMNYAIVATPDRAMPSPQRTGQLTLTSTDGRPFKVLGANSTPVQVLKAEPSGGERALKVTFAYDLGADTPMPHDLVIETDHPDAPVIALPVMLGEVTDPEMEYIKVLREIFIQRKGLNVGVVRPSKPIEFKTNLTMRDETLPVKVYADSPDIDVELVSNEAYGYGKGREITVRVTNKGVRSGHLLTPIYFQVEEFTTRIWASGSLRSDDGVTGSAAATGS